ncbi:MAG: peroxiredoxin [Thermoleophilia bacterium]
MINLATGLEDAERVTIAFLNGTAGLEQGKRRDVPDEGRRPPRMPGHADAVACDGCPPLARLFQQFADGGGELLVCPICFKSRKLDEASLVANARLAGATPPGSGSATERPSSLPSTKGGN